MAIRVVRGDCTAYCDTPAEAAQLLQLLATGASRGNGARPAQNRAGKAATPPRQVWRFLVALRDHGGSLKTHDAATALAIQPAKLAQLINQTKAWAAEMGYDRNALTTTAKAKSGKKVVSVYELTEKGMEVAKGM